MEKIFRKDNEEEKERRDQSGVAEGARRSGGGEGIVEAFDAVHGILSYLRLRLPSSWMAHICI